MVEVPYNNIPASVNDVVSGRIPVGMFSLSVVEGQVRGGALKVLASASAGGIASMPNVQPIASQFPGFDYLGWFMLMAPAATPEPIIAEMHKALTRVLTDPAVREAAPRLGFELDPRGLASREDSLAFLKRQLALWDETTRRWG